VRRNIGLNNDRRLFRVYAGGDKKRCSFADLTRKLVRLLIHSDRVQIDDAEDTFVPSLNLSPVFQCSEIIAYVELTTGLNARENTCFHSLGIFMVRDARTKH